MKLLDLEGVAGEGGPAGEAGEIADKEPMIFTQLLEETGGHREGIP